jgi:hypothetical protein
VFQPDWAATQLGFWLRDASLLGQPWQSDDERDAELMFRSGFLLPKDYYGEGPRGLAMRTHVGPHYVEQFGIGRLTSLPLAVEARPWGGYRIDLIAAPWKASVEELLGAWRSGMAHLEAASIFAQPTLVGEQLLGWTKGEHCQVGGVL